MNLRSVNSSTRSALEGTNPEQKKAPPGQRSEKTNRRPDPSETAPLLRDIASLKTQEASAKSHHQESRETASTLERKSNQLKTQLNLQQKNLIAIDEQLRYFDKLDNFRPDELPKWEAEKEQCLAHIETTKANLHDLGHALDQVKGELLVRARELQDATAALVAAQKKQDVQTPRARASIRDFMDETGKLNPVRSTSEIDAKGLRGNLEFLARFKELLSNAREARDALRQSQLTRPSAIVGSTEDAKEMSKAEDERSAKADLYDTAIAAMKEAVTLMDRSFVEMYNETRAVASLEDDPRVKKALGNLRDADEKPGPVAVNDGSITLSNGWVLMPSAKRMFAIKMTAAALIAAANVVLDQIQGRQRLPIAAMMALSALLLEHNRLFRLSDATLFCAAVLLVCGSMS
jgi:hypothetical protein